MGKKILWSGSIILPAPVEITSNDEIIWSSHTGRAASGDMIGDVVAQKKNISIKWGVLEESELSKIKKVLAAGFFPISFRDDGAELTIKVYRGTLSKEHLGYVGDGKYYYRSASVDIVQN